MPLYEYFCADCKDRFEILTSYAASQSENIVCATCHGTHVRKLLSLTARRTHGGSAGDADFGDADFGDSDGGDMGDEMGGGCGCGGACSCNN